jgi:hypothetical protein
MIQPLREPPKASRSSLMPLVVCGTVASASILCMVLLGLSLVPFTLFLFAVVGLGHYVLWGESMTSEVAQEREAFLRQQARDLEDQQGWSQVSARPIRDR